MRLRVVRGVELLSPSGSHGPMWSDSKSCSARSDPSLVISSAPHSLLASTNAETTAAPEARAAPMAGALAAREADNSPTAAKSALRMRRRLIDRWESDCGELSPFAFEIMYRPYIAAIARQTHITLPL